MKLTVFYIGSFILIAGILFLGAQDDVQTADSDQEAAEREETTAQLNSGAAQPAASQEAPAQNGSAREEEPPPAESEQSAAPAPAVPAAANIPAAQPEVARPEPAPAETAVAPEKESAPATPAADFEIDRGKTRGGEEAGATEQARKEEKPAGGEKPEGRKSWWGKLFGPGRGPPSAAPAAGAATPAAAPKKEPTPEELLAAHEEVRRQAREVEGLKKLDQARQAMPRGEFEEALKLFNDALISMPARPHTVELRQKARADMAECEYRLALTRYRAGEIAEARQSISRALEYHPQHRGAARLSERIKADETQRTEIETRPVPLKKEPVYLDKQNRIKAELQRGREYLALQEYDQAEDKFKSVLIEERLNAAASAELKKIAERRYKLDSDDLERLKAEMLAQIRDAWTPPVKKPIVAPGAIAKTEIISTAQKRVIDKLNRITLPEIDFRDASIDNIVTTLIKQSQLFDRDSPPGERGVNFVLNMRRPGQAPAVSAAPPAADVFAAEEAKPAEGAVETRGLPTVNLHLNNVSLIRLLKTVTDVMGLKYRIEENIVYIHPADVVQGELETREFRIFGSLVETLQAGAAAGAEAAAGGKLEIGAGGGGGALPERQDMKQFFVDAGIPFPQGTSLKYLPGQSLLIVKNTVENLEAVDRLLSKINVPPMQVEIEARFVEIGQNDLEELGLEWLLTDNWELAEKTSGTLPPSMRQRIQMNKNQLTKGMRYFNVSGGQITPTAGGTMAGLVSISSILTNPELTVILHALQQRDGINLLSAPKVTTKSGAAASIKVVEELIYPTEYQQNAQSIGTTTSGNQSLTQIIVTPSGFETRDLGVLLEVTPTVGPDKETIDLALLPQVVELARWIDYGSDVPSADPSRTQHLTLLQPVFHSRQITTSISIWDGQTVVMGGLITEGQRNSEDKVPLLGDIPLLGYLFRSKTTQSIKKNLLIFVTANLVDPAGNKIKKETAPAATASAGNAAAAMP